MLKSRIKAFFTTQMFEVFHEDSPGIRVYVRRNWWQRLMYDKVFSEVTEKHYPACEAKNGHYTIVPLTLTTS